MSSLFEHSQIELERARTLDRLRCQNGGTLRFVASHAMDSGGPRVLPLMKIGQDRDGDIYVTADGQLSPYRQVSLNLSRLDRAGLTELLIEARRARRIAERQRGERTTFYHQGVRYRTDFSGASLDREVLDPSGATAPWWTPEPEWSPELTAAARQAAS